MTLDASLEEVAGVVCDILSHSARPVKARELTRLLGSKLVSSFDKREVNSLLYRLEKQGIVSRDDQFRWSFCATATRPESDETRSAPLTDPQEKKSARQLGTDAISAPVGHWLITLGREPATDREVWRMECILCGFRTAHRVQADRYVLPLTGNLRDRRRKHDRAAHPGTLKDQGRAEKLLLGTLR
jgi:hypothetical protein